MNEEVKRTLRLIYIDCPACGEKESAETVHVVLSSNGKSTAYNTGIRCKHCDAREHATLTKDDYKVLIKDGIKE